MNDRTNDGDRPNPGTSNNDLKDPLLERDIVADAEPGNEQIENADESVERAGW